MSIEAGNPKTRKKILKRDMDDNQIIRAHRLCEKYGIYTFTNCIVGLPGSSLKDEAASVDLCVECRVDWAEFLIYHPYPGTELGDEAINQGHYSPDYAKMHTSYMYSSPLTCFNKKEKNAHRNLAVLGAVAVVYPKLKDLIVKRLIYWPHNSLFTVCFYLVKMYIIRAKIYVTKTSFKESAGIFLRSLKQEFFRHESADKV
jgi:anaerobic magnesium-protoporphyrin IX monomethyl ester cyclase